MNGQRTGLLLLLVIPLVVFLPQPASGQQSEAEFGEVSDLDQVNTSDEDQFPPLELRVLSVEGDPLKIRPEDDEWKPVRKGEVLPEQTRVVTEQNDTIRLEIPGVSFIEVDTSTEIVLDKLIRKEETRIRRSGLLMDAEKNTINEIELESPAGEINNSLRENNEMKSDYKLKTPNAVAGVRGTSFACEVKEGTTNCSVLEGEVSLTSRDDPSIETMLGPGLSGAFGQARTEPDTSDKISTGTRHKLEQTRDQAEHELLLEPRIGNFEVKNQSFRETEADTYRAQVDYYRPRTLPVRGEAKAREPGATLEAVHAQVNGQSREVQGLQDWSIELRPDTLPPGQERNVTARLEAEDDSATQSYPAHLRLELSHPDAADVLPVDYVGGDVDVQLTTIGERSIGNVSFPYHVFRDDRAKSNSSSSSTLELSGTADGPGSIEGVAYSLNNGISWNETEGAKNWTYDLSLASVPRKQYDLEMIAWTDNETIGSSQDIEPFVYHDQNLRAHFQDRFREFWEAFTNQSTEKIASLTTDDLGYTDAVSEESFGKDSFLDRLGDLFSRTRNLRVFHEVQEIQFQGDSGRITFNLEIQGDHPATGERLKIVGTPVEMKFRRTDDGRIRITDIQGMTTSMYLFNETPKRVQSGQGVNLESLDIVPRTESDVWFIKPRTRGDSWVIRTQGTLQTGGIFRLSTNNLEEVFPIPRTASRLYQSAARLQENRLYAVNFRRENGSKRVALIQPRNITNTTFNVEIVSLQDF